MHGMINKAVQCFVRDTYGAASWVAVTRRAQLDFTEFEAMLHYDDEVTKQVIAAISEELSVPRHVVLEDIGTYLVSHPNVEALRRLLRFSGVTFWDFLHSLDDLRARSRLALADLDMPDLELHDLGDNLFLLQVRHEIRGFSYVVMGVLRTMADDYGALVLLEHETTANAVDRIRIQLVEQSFHSGRHFNLGAKSA